MGLDYKDLTAKTRQFMVEEIQSDIENDVVSLSSWLELDTRDQWPQLLCRAAEMHDDDWLANEIVERGLLKVMTTRKDASNGVISVKVPKTGHTTLAEIEFNNYYCRAICRVALEKGSNTVLAYRAKGVKEFRPESEEKIGKQFSPKAILDDLRSSQGQPPELGIPAGPNSGLSLRLI